MTAPQTPVQGIRFDPQQGAWLVHSAATARVVLSDDNNFSAEGYSVLEPDISDIRRFIMADAERHRVLRRFFSHALSPSCVRCLDETVFTPAAKFLVTSLPVNEVVNLQNQFVTPYTRTAIYAAIGINKAIGDELVTMFHIVARLFDNDRLRAIAGLKLLRQRAADICLDTGPDAAENSILGAAAKLHWLEEGLNIEDLVCFIMPLVEAAAVKDHRDLTASLLRRVAEMRVEQQEQLLDHRRLTRAAEEAIRMQSGGFLPRIARETVQLDGHTIKRGEYIYVSLEDVGQDPTVFSDPEKFCPERADRRQAIPFGAGIHRCVGDNLARRIAIRACATILRDRTIRMIDACDKSFSVTLGIR
jgi:cytochrome P450